MERLDGEMPPDMELDAAARSSHGGRASRLGGNEERGGGSTGVGFIEGVWECQGLFGGACELALGRCSRATSAFSWVARNGGWRGCVGRWRRWIVRWDSNREHGLARLGVVKVGHGELARGVRGARCHGARCQVVEEGRRFGREKREKGRRKGELAPCRFGKKVKEEEGVRPSAGSRPWTHARRATGPGGVGADAAATERRARARETDGRNQMAAAEIGAGERRSSTSERGRRRERRCFSRSARAAHVRAGRRRSGREETIGRKREKRPNDQEGGEIDFFEGISSRNLRSI